MTFQYSKLLLQSRKATSMKPTSKLSHRGQKGKQQLCINSSSAVCTICRKLGAVTVVEIINVTFTEFHLPGLIGGIKLGFIEATLLFILIFPFPIPVLHLHTFTYLYPLNLWRTKDAFTYKINLHTINFQHVIWPEQKADLNFELIVISHLNDLEVPSISADVPMFLQTWGVKQTSIKE